jgi:hypothetical protein
MIKIHTFKEKGKEGGEGRPQFDGQWKVPCLVAFGRRRRNILFTSFYFPPHEILLKPFFSIDFRVLFYHGFKPLLRVFP